MNKDERGEEVLEAMEEIQDLVEVEDILFVTTVEHRDTTHETVPIPSLHVIIASITIILLKNAYFAS